MNSLHQENSGCPSAGHCDMLANCNSPDQQAPKAASKLDPTQDANQTQTTIANNCNHKLNNIANNTNHRHIESKEKPNQALQNNNNNNKLTDPTHEMHEKQTTITLPGIKQFEHNRDPDTSSQVSVQFNCSNCICSSQGGLIDDFRRRSKYYLSDFSDGILGKNSIHKTSSATIFLYFSVLLPCIAFGVVDTNNTDGYIDPKKTMIGQAVGGLVFALIGGQPLVIIMTTAPLCIYVKVVYQFSQNLEVDFGAFYACVGLWLALFLVLFSITNLSNLMKFFTRSTEDIFAIFTAFAFGSDGVKEALRSFNRYYWNPECVSDASQTVASVVQVQNHHLHANNSTPQTNDSIGLTHPPLPESLRSASDFISSIVTSNASTGYLGDSIRSMTGHSSVFDAATTTTTTTNATTFPSLRTDDAHQISPLASETVSFPSRCQRETCILFLFLMFGTLWLANSFSSFDKTPYLSSGKREVIKDYALAISVLVFSFVGSYIFMEIHLDVFEFNEFSGIQLAQLRLLSVESILYGALLGFMLSILFFIDQNICGAMVHNAPYKLKKGNYFHLDLLILAILNAGLTFIGLPLMHGKLPHSHLHSKALADYEEQIENGRVESSIVSIRETRLTQLFCSILIGLSLFAVPYPIAHIPLPVLSGVFLYTALAEFKSNSMAQRICLLFTEPAAYPSNHFTRLCPRRKIHLFTFAQVAQLAIVSFVGFYPNPYVNMSFPLVIATFVPFRTLLLPRLIESRYLQALDQYSME